MTYVLHDLKKRIKVNKNKLNSESRASDINSKGGMNKLCSIWTQLEWHTILQLTTVGISVGLDRLRHLLIANVNRGYTVRPKHSFHKTHSQ